MISIRKRRRPADLCIHANQPRSIAVSSNPLRLCVPIGPRSAKLQLVWGRVRFAGWRRRLGSYGRRLPCLA